MKHMFFLSLDVNECRKEVCKFPSLCRNTVGSYMCDCPDGYKLRGRKNSGRCIGKNELFFIFLFYFIRFAN